jgi:hypothetical protein
VEVGAKGLEPVAGRVQEGTEGRRLAEPVRAMEHSQVVSTDGRLRHTFQGISIPSCCTVTQSWLVLGLIHISVI